jgi:hypothetical protein
MEIDDKGGECTKIWKIWKLLAFELWYDQGGEIDDVGHGHVQRGSNIKEYKGIKILGQKKHTSRGSKLMNLVFCIWYVHIHVLACIA